MADAEYSNDGMFDAVGTNTNSYRLTVKARTTRVTGGTLVEVFAEVTKTRTHGSVDTTSIYGTRSWTLPGGRTATTGGSANSSGSSSWSYLFPAASTNTVNVYNYFNVYVPSSYGASTTLSVTATGSGSSFLTSRTVSVNVPLFSTTTYTATYNGNNATSGSTSSTSYVSPTQANGTIATNGFSRTGYSFSGWNTAANGGGTSYAQGSNFTGNLTLYAQWSANYYQIDYNSSNGSVSGSGTTSSNSTLYPNTSITTRTNGFTAPSGYVFGGWSTSQDNTADYSAGSSFTIDISSNSYNPTFYAVWIQTNPVFSNSAITTTGTLAKNINTNADYTVAASPVTGYSLVSSGSGLNPTAWLSINSSGQLSGVPPAIGTYTFKIRATNNGNNTDTAEISLVISPPGFRMTGSSTKTRLSSAKRFIGAGQSTTNIQGQTIGPDANGYVSLTKMAVYKAGVWVDISNIS